jgi:transcriptional regulator with XRE-family HTH domain
MQDTAPTAGRGSSVPKRSLGRYLRLHREAAALSVRTVARRLSVTESTVWRWEYGRVTVKPMVVESLCRIYGVAQGRAAALIALAAETRHAAGWWADYVDVIPPDLDLFLGLEATATRIDGYAVEMVPGLLQTEQYARMMISAPGYAEGDVERLVRLRMERQEAILRRSLRRPELRFVLSELVMRQGDPVVVAGQRRALLDADQSDMVQVRVSTFAGGVTHVLGCGPFVLLRFPNDGDGPAEPDTVYVDGFTGGLFLEKPAEIERYDAAFGRIWEHSVSISEWAGMAGEEAAASG